MTAKPASALLEILVPAYRMHTQLFNNALEGIKEEDAKKRLNGVTNHIVWIAGNLVNCRYWLADILKLDARDPNNDLFAEAKALDESFHYPSLASLKDEWHKISQQVFQKLMTLTDNDLHQPYKFGMNIDFVEENVANMVGMCVGREDYLLGQLALMRKALGYGGMKYDINKDINY